MSLDLNECTNDNGGCEQICTNTIGSYVCSCLDGYSLNNNNHNCTGIWRLLNIDTISTWSFLDINECIFSNGDCNHDCTNIPGSYSCSCRAGYILNTDGHNCSGELAISNNFYVSAFIQDINECDIYNGGCEQICHNINGSYHCSCLSGYSLESSNCIGQQYK